MISLALALLITMQTLQTAAQDPTKDALARAEALYFEAKFNESIQVLSQVNETLRTQPGRLKERIATKFQLALANLGLNNPSAAKSFLMEIYGLDPDFTVDAQQFSPKVVTLANEAKVEQGIIRCKTALSDAKKGLADGNGAAVLSLIQSMKPKCSELATVETETAELLFRNGLNDYKQGFLPGASEKFRAALTLAPKHEMAAQYLELTETKMQVAGDRVLLDWQKSFQTRQFKQAAAVYRQIASFGDATNNQTLNTMGAEYRKALDPLVDSFNKACSTGENAKANEIRDQISDLIPEPSFGADIRSKMVPCNPPAPPTPALPTVTATTPAPADTKVAVKIEPRPDPKASSSTSAKPPVSASAKPPVSANPKPDSSADKKPSAPKTDCFQMDSALALIRLKHRVEPIFSQQAVAYLQTSSTTVTVKVRIEDNGSVTVIEAMGANTILNNAVRSAVESWKFTPAMDEKGPRCVDTEIPIVISRR